MESVKQAGTSIGAGRSRAVKGNKGSAKATEADFACVGPLSSGTAAFQVLIPLNRFVEQAWQQASPNAALESEWGIDEQWGAEGEEDEEIECVVCQKTFKSEKAWANHEQSRKHLKEVEQ